MEQGIELVESQLSVHSLLLVLLVQQFQLELDLTLSIALYHAISRRNYRKGNKDRQNTFCSLT